MGVRSSFRWSFDLPKGEGQLSATRDSVTSGAALTGAYLAVNGAAVLIASFGLLQDSAAVTIGAMLISHALRSDHQHRLKAR